MAKVGETHATSLPILAVLGFFSAPFTGPACRQAGFAPPERKRRRGLGQAFRPGWRAAHNSFFRCFFS